MDGDKRMVGGQLVVVQAFVAHRDANFRESACEGGSKHKEGDKSTVGGLLAGQSKASVGHATVGQTCDRTYIHATSEQSNTERDPQSSG